MKFLVALAKLLAMIVLLTAVAASQGGGTQPTHPEGGGVPAAVHYIDHDKVAAALAKVGKERGPLVNDPGLTVLANRRGAGHVEYHDHTNHIWIIVEGEATVVTGGTMVDAKRISPDQMMAAAIEGGEIHHLSKGDVITIPAKTPHWWKEVPTKTVAYYAVDIGR